MTRRLFAAFSFVCLFASVSFSQNNGVLPLTGLRFFNEGISAKSIEVRIDGAQLINNRIPLNKDIEILLTRPAGFAESNKILYAGAEFALVSPRGELLSQIPNLLAANQSTGFIGGNLSALSIKFGITSEMIRANMNGTVKIRLYDLKGKSQMRLEIPITLARKDEPLQVSKATRSIPAKNGAVGVVNGLKAKNVLVSLDTSITVAPKMAYTSLDISAIEGSSISGIFQGKESFWVYDDNLNEVKITDILLKQVKGAMENNNVDYTLKIPYRPKNTTAKTYTVRFRWESPDRKQLIDVVVKI
ncbi:MAG TPA: hypothetical protein PLZ45_09855 [Ferruginibacter sp.]|nr:hypothetical protein [Chitinophagaceae bacterium]HRI24972.1 hypothetical protein [Ferruginibacter sp.]